MDTKVTYRMNGLEPLDGRFECGLYGSTIQLNRATENSVFVDIFRQYDAFVVILYFWNATSFI
jgi:hypothetical protein